MTHVGAPRQPGRAAPSESPPPAAVGLPSEPFAPPGALFRGFAECARRAARLPALALLASLALLPPAPAGTGGGATDASGASADPRARPIAGLRATNVSAVHCAAVDPLLARLPATEPSEVAPAVTLTLRTEAESDLCLYPHDPNWASVTASYDCATTVPDATATPTAEGAPPTVALPGDSAPRMACVAPRQGADPVGPGDWRLIVSREDGS